MKIAKLTSFLAILGIMVLSCGNSGDPAVMENDNSAMVQENQPIVHETNQNPQGRVPEDLSGKVQVLTEEEFAQKITEFDNEKGFQYKGKTPCVVDFYADWCRPCAALNPIMVELAEKYKGQLIVYKVNVDQCKALAEAYDVRSIPTALFFPMDGCPVKMVGAISKRGIEQMIHEVLLKTQPHHEEV